MSSWAPSMRPVWGAWPDCVTVAEVLLRSPPPWAKWPFVRPTVTDLATAIQAHPASVPAILSHLESNERDAWGQLRDELSEDLASALQAAWAQREADWVAQQGLVPVYPVGHRLGAPWHTQVVAHDQRRGRYHLEGPDQQWRSVPYEAFHGLCPSPAHFALRPPPLGEQETCP